MVNESSYGIARSRWGEGKFVNMKFGLDKYFFDPQNNHVFSFLFLHLNFTHTWSFLSTFDLVKVYTVFMYTLNSEPKALTGDKSEGIKS